MSNEPKRALNDQSQKYGYDVGKVAAIPCRGCGQPIGDEDYTEDRIQARFGLMSFWHARCDPDLKGRK